MNLKILMIVPKFPFPICGGLEKQSLLLAEYLVKSGVEVTVLSTSFFKSHRFFEDFHGINVYRISKFDNKFISIFYQFFFIPFFLFIYRNKFNIIHIHQHSLFGIYSLFCSKLFRLKTVLKLPNIGEKGLLGVANSFLGGLKIFLLKKADAIIAMTPTHMKELLSLSFSKEKIYSIPNGIIINPFLKLNFNKEGLVKFCYIGRLERQKGILFLLECWVIISKSFPNARLEIVGEGSLKEKISSYIDEFIPNQSVVLSGYTDNVEEVLIRSDVFIITSQTEGMSNAILEAMSFGKSIIASNVGGASIQFKNNFLNSTFELNDKDKLLYLISKNVIDEDFRRNNSETNYLRTNVFNIEGVAFLYIQLYENLIKNLKSNISNYDY